MKQALIMAIVAALALASSGCFVAYDYGHPYRYSRYPYHDSCPSTRYAPVWSYRSPRGHWDGGGHRSWGGGRYPGGHRGGRCR